MLKSAVWRDGQLRTEFEDPFENLRRSNRLSRTKQKENGAAVSESQDWLPRLGFELWLTPPELLVALLGKVLGQDRQNARSRSPYQNRIITNRFLAVWVVS